MLLLPAQPPDGSPSPPAMPFPQRSAGTHRPPHAQGSSAPPLPPQTSRGKDASPSRGTHHWEIIFSSLFMLKPAKEEEGQEGAEASDMFYEKELNSDHFSSSPVISFPVSPSQAGRRAEGINTRRAYQEFCSPCTRRGNKNKCDCSSSHRGTRRQR